MRQSSLDEAVTGDFSEILVTIYGEPIGRRFELGDVAPAAILGRDPEAPLSIDDDSVSRAHCEFQQQDDGWYVQDLGSTNGTYVAGEQIDRAKLSDGDHIKVGSTILKYLSTANVEAAYYEEIYRMAIFDGLTQIHNRRYLREFTEREISRCKRHGRPLSLMIFDVDHFKLINDEHGHLMGDYVLRELAGRVGERIRKEELFARYGGDEFVVVLPEALVTEAEKFAEAILDLVCTRPFEFHGESLPVTISIGIGALSNDIETPSQLIKAADDALYRAKRGGRARVAL